MTDFQEIFSMLLAFPAPFQLQNPHDPNNRMIMERKALSCPQLLREFREFRGYLLDSHSLGQCVISLRWLQHTSARRRLQHTSPRRPTPSPAETKPQHAQKRSCESNRWRH